MLRVGHSETRFSTRRHYSSGSWSIKGLHGTCCKTILKTSRRKFARFIILAAKGILSLQAQAAHNPLICDSSIQSASGFDPVDSAEYFRAVRTTPTIRANYRRTEQIPATFVTNFPYFLHQIQVLGQECRLNTAEAPRLQSAEAVHDICRAVRMRETFPRKNSAFF